MKKVFLYIVCALMVSCSKTKDSTKPAIIQYGDGVFFFNCKEDFRASIVEFHRQYPNRVIDDVVMDDNNYVLITH